MVAKTSSSSSTFMRGSVMQLIPERNRRMVSKKEGVWAWLFAWESEYLFISLSDILIVTCQTSSGIEVKTSSDRHDNGFRSDDFLNDQDGGVSLPLNARAECHATPPDSSSELITLSSLLDQRLSSRFAVCVKTQPVVGESPEILPPSYDRLAAMTSLNGTHGIGYLSSCWNSFIASMAPLPPEWTVTNSYTNRCFKGTEQDSIEGGHKWCEQRVSAAGNWRLIFPGSTSEPEMRDSE